MIIFFNELIITEFAVYHSEVYCCVFWQFEFVYRWHQTTLSDPLEAAKTAWPVSYVEAIFLPEFKIKGDVTGRDFQVLLVL
jgi:hypothetical protein